MRIVYIYVLALMLLVAGSSSVYAFGGGAIRDVLGYGTKTVFISGGKQVEHTVNKRIVSDLSHSLNNPSTREAAKKSIGNLKLTDEQRSMLFSDVLIEQGKITRKDATEMYSSLHGVPGYSSALSKISGASTSKSIGHLYEIKISHAFKRVGVQVHSLGHRFDDGLKRGITDADVLAYKGDKMAIIEAKNYAVGKMPAMDVVRADMQSMRKFRSPNGFNSITRVFAMSHRPSNPNHLSLLEREARKTGTVLVFGNADDVAMQVNQLLR